MSYTLVVVTFPVDVEFRRYRHQLSEIKPCWRDHGLKIQTVTGKEAPVRYIGRSFKGAPLTHVFSIRYYDRRLWWPLLERSAPVSVENYIARSRDSSGPFLSMMNMSSSTLDGPRAYDVESFINDILANWVSNPSWERRRRLAEDIADRTLFCDGEVYLAGGCPAYFGRRKKDEIRLEIGSLHAEKVGAIHRFLPGPDWRQREEAACRSHVFLPSDMRNELQTPAYQGLKVKFLSSVNPLPVVEGLPELLYPHPAEFCADAVLRKVTTRSSDPDLAQMSGKLSAEFREAMLRSKMISPRLCQEALEKIIALWPYEKGGLERQWVEKAQNRLGSHAGFSAEEEIALEGLT